MSAADSLSSVDFTFSATSPSGVSAALTALIVSATSSATDSLTSGTTLDARNSDYGSSRTTRSCVWIRGSAVKTLATFTVPAASSSTVVSPVPLNSTSMP
jgi:hypothetical protein